MNGWNKQKKQYKHDLGIVYISLFIAASTVSIIHTMFGRFGMTLGVIPSALIIGGVFFITIVQMRRKAGNGPVRIVLGMLSAFVIALIIDRLLERFGVMLGVLLSGLIIADINYIVIWLMFRSFYILQHKSCRNGVIIYGLNHRP